MFIAVARLGSYCSIVQMSVFIPPGDCPVCGEAVPAGAASCRSCGSCPDSGWSDETVYDGLDLPDEAFEDESITTMKKSEKPLWKRLTMAAALLAVAILLWAISKP